MNDLIVVTDSDVHIDYVLENIIYDTLEPAQTGSKLTIGG
jgi:hypothetical protein